MDQLTPVLSEQDIRRQVEALAEKISGDYQGREIVVVCVLKGAFIFAADLVRRLRVSSFIDFVRLSSYGDCTQSSGCVRMDKDIETDISGKDVLIVEDIVDTGRTMAFLKERLAQRAPGSLAVCAMIDKTERREVPLDIEYCCFSVPEGFLVGYGLDYAEKYRELPGIYHLEPN